MGLSCGAQVLRWATFAFSIVVFVFGFAVVIVGSLATFFLKNSYKTLEFSAAIPIVALVVGIFICLCGLLGCLGALRESRGMLNIYSFLVAILVIVEIALCAATLAKKTELGSAVESMVKTSFSKQFNDPTIRSAFGLMEEELDCCGIKGASDYKNANQDIPRTCEWEHYRNGCAMALSMEFQKFTFVLPVAVIVLGLLQFLAVAGACCLANSIKHQPLSV